MPDTRAGRLLTEAHRRSQLKVRAATLRDLLAIWPAFSMDDIDGSWPPVEAGLVALIGSRRRQSSDLAANYFRAFRTAEKVPGNATPHLADEPNPTLLLATLRLIGPIMAKKNIAAAVPKPAERTLTRLTGSVSRQVLDGGRQTLTQSIKADPAARGYRRVTGGRACSFCTELAAQELIGDSVDFQAHDHCSCTQEPVYGGTVDQFNSFLSGFEQQVADISARGSDLDVSQTAGGRFVVRR